MPTTPTPALPFVAKVRGQKLSSSSPSYYKVTSRGPIDLNSDNSWTQKITAECLWQDLFKYMPVRCFSNSPDFPQLLCDSASAAYKAPGCAVLTITYRGIPFQLPPGDEEMIVSTQEQPIETHPKFVTDLAGTSASPLTVNLPNFDTDGTFLGFLPGSPFSGIESYLSPSITFRSNYAAFNRPDISPVGFIWIPDNAPSAPDPKNWLCTGITWRRYGGYYSINEDSLLSGPNGWNKTIYTRGT